MPIILVVIYHMFNSCVAIIVLYKLYFYLFRGSKSARKDFLADALAENQLATQTLQNQVENLILSSNQVQKSVEVGKQQQDEQIKLLQTLMVSGRITMHLQAFLNPHLI